MRNSTESRSRTDRFHHNDITSWAAQFRHLFMGGRVTLINSVLNSLTMHMIFFFGHPTGVVVGERFERRVSNWNTYKKNQNY